MVSLMARPRKYPLGTTASDRVVVGNRALEEAGGARKTFRLSPAANAALTRLLSLPGAPASATELVEGLLLKAAEAAAKEP